MARRAVVLGAGVSGLLSAYYIKKYNPGLDVKVLERDTRAGGLVDTLIHQNQYYELGPRGIRTRRVDRAAFDLIKELGLWDQVVLGDGKANARYIYAQGKLRKIPSNPISALLSPVTRGGFGAIVRDMRVRPKRNVQDESVSAFAYRHFGPRISMGILDTVVSGIWAGDIERLSVRATMPGFVELESKYGSLIKGFAKSRRRGGARSEQDDRIHRSGVLTFKGGMSGFISALQENLKGSIHFSSEVRRLERVGQGYKIHLNQGESIEADVVVSTLPSYALSRLTRSIGESLASYLDEVRYAPLAVVPVHYKRRVHAHRGFGYLVQQNQECGVLGVQWNEQTFPTLNQTAGSSFTVMIGGSRFTNFARYSKADFIEMAQSSLQSHLGFKGTSDFAHCKVIPKALPQYAVGHLDRMVALQAACPRNFHIRGNFIGGVGISSIVPNAQATGLKIRNELRGIQS